MKAKNVLWILLLVVTSCSITALAEDSVKPAPATKPAPFILCQSTYALCTFSPCTGVEVLGKAATTTCDCDLKIDQWSVGQKACPTQQEVSKNQTKSRYSPIKCYTRCSNNRPWAMCLDSPCTIHGSKATCTCSIQQGLGDYLALPEKPGVSSQCATGIISSATVDDLDGITDFLQTQDKLRVFDFKVVNPQPKLVVNPPPK